MDTIDWKNILSLSHIYREQEIIIYKKYHAKNKKNLHSNKSSKSLLFKGSKKRYQRKMLAKKYGLICFYCNDKKENLKELQREHIIAKAKGGKNVMKNFVLSCEQCNVNKKDKYVLDFAYTYLSITNIILLLNNLQQKIKYHWR